MTSETPRAHTQKELIRNMLLLGQEITPLDALDRIGSFRLGARIYDLRQEGMDIETRLVRTPGGATVASYKLSTHQYGF